jgi:hypothetical protein
VNKPIVVVAFIAAATAALGAQQASQSSTYEGTSTPPPDDTIITSTMQEAKPSAAHPESMPQAAPMQAQPMQQAPAVNPSDANLAPVGNANYGAMSSDGTDDGTVQVAPPLRNSEMAQRLYTPDPDSDIVHPAPLGPGELGEGTSIRVELIGELSSTRSEQGQPFRSRVASDVLSGGQVLIPAGSEIDGRVVNVSSGHFGGYGSLMLRPEKVILPNGSSYQLHAMVSDTAGSHTWVGAEGVIRPDSRMKRDGIEYGAVVGGGAITGAFLGGPVGALAGSIVGAGVVTTHLLVSHPQANLDSGTTLMLTLTERMHLVPSGSIGE